MSLILSLTLKLDLCDDQQPTLQQELAPLMHEFREIETCIECSSINLFQVRLVSL
jgi:Ras family protein T1